MKISISFGFALLVILSSCSTNCEPCPEQTENSSEEFNDYGADDYGMHSYVMAFLYKGENREQDSLKAILLQEAHLANINKMAESGDLVLAGPFLDNGDLRGIYVFDVQTIEEAEALTNTDPAIQSGHLRMELTPWYGSAGLKGLMDFHNELDSLRASTK